ncbi:MAG: hypothetical protein H6Q86_852, partial [candidate division NC10 bacterium]|nr:hypothetical protein [candidate division NC10 bacterium]
VLIFRRFVAESGAPWRLIFVLNSADIRQLHHSMRSLVSSHHVA